MSIQIIVTPDSLMSIFEDGKFVGRVGLAYDQPVNDPQALVDLFTQGGAHVTDARLPAEAFDPTTVL